MTLQSIPGRVELDSNHYVVLGKMAWLWMNSPLHRDWSIDLLTRFALPAIELGQYLLLEREGVPVAYCSWAHMSEQAEAAYMLDPSKLDLADWHGGDHLWFVDWVAPFNARDSWSLKRQLAQRFPLSVARAIRVKRSSTAARVMEFKGRMVDSSVARKILDRYAADFLQNLAAQPKSSMQQ